MLRKRKLEQPKSNKKYSIHIHTEGTGIGGSDTSTINTISDGSNSSNINSVRRDSKQVRFLMRRQSNVFEELVGNTFNSIKTEEGRRDSKHLSNIIEESSV